MLSLLVGGTDVFTGDTLFKNSVGGVRAPGHTTYADLKRSIMDVLLELPPGTTIRPGHTDPTTVAEERESNAFVRVWRGLDPEGSEECTAMGEPATLVLLGDDYDGGHKAWVRWPDGADDIVPGSQVQPVSLAWRGVSDEKRTHGGLSVKTLLIAGAASAAAALVIPMLWRPGTVFAAAMTPVVVALVSELLRRPVETVSSVRVRRTARGTAILDPPPEEPFDPLAPPSAEELAVLPEETAPPRAVHRRRPLTARQWKLALATGLVAFAGVAAVVTASELVAGDAVSGGGTRTTFFGGSQSERDEPAVRPRRGEEGAARRGVHADGDPGADRHAHPDAQRHAGADGHADRQPHPGADRAGAHALTPSGRAQGPHPHVAGRAHGPHRAARGGPGDAPARHPGRQPHA